MKIKKWFRKRYLIWKYKHNWNTGKVIVLTSEDRQLGLTTMMIKDCLEKGYVLLVNTNSDKWNMAHEMYLCGQLMFSHPITEANAYKYCLMSLDDVKNNKHIGLGIKLIVDNSCHDLDALSYLHPYIANGFIYVPIAA